jgi:hypothetical protein
MSLIPPLRGTPLYRYIPGVGRAVAQDLTVAKYSTFGGNVLVVDQVYGNDTLAGQDPFNRPFLTLTAALTKATSGMCVFLMSGVYQGPITIPTGVAIRGVSVQTVSINALNVTSATTLVTMGIQTRLEDVTLNLTSASDVNLIGVDFPSGTPQTAKLRTMVVNVTSTATGSCTSTGVRSAGTSSTVLSSAQSIRAATINVVSAGTGAKRGILVSAANRFSIRDTNVFVSGSSPDNVGVETTHASAIAELKSSSISGLSTAVDQTLVHDINRVAGNIVLGFTDLTNNDANGNSFSTTVEPAQIGFGILGNLAADRTYYLVPSIVPINELQVDTNPTFTLAKTFQVPFNQPVIIFSILVRFTGTIGVGQSVSFRVHKNGSSTPSLTVTLNAGETTKIDGASSVVFATNDRFHTEAITTGNVGAGTFFASVATY